MNAESTAASVNLAPVQAGFVGRIPVRNLWLLMLYASDLFRHHGRARISFEEAPDDIPELVAKILVDAVERRLRRNLSSGRKIETAVLSRVRGRIDMLATERYQLLNRGHIACEFEKLTIDTPRNRYVLGALIHLSRLVHRRDLASRCRALANTLKTLGVSGILPSAIEMSADRYVCHDPHDQLMVTAATLAYELSLPTESLGDAALLRPEREITWVRRLFEKAVAGFYEVVLRPIGWRVQAQKTIDWLIDLQTSRINDILPKMRTDIVLDRLDNGGRIVIDTKFTSIVTSGWYRDESLRSGYIYQIYAYLRSQEGMGDNAAEHASGLLLHPAIDEMVDETVVTQGHAIRFATVDLTGTPGEIRKRLLDIVEFPFTL